MQTLGAVYADASTGLDVTADIGNSCSADPVNFESSTLKAKRSFCWCELGIVDEGDPSFDVNGTCEGHCGGQGTSCWCDAGCVANGDCCGNYGEVCGG